MCAAQRTARTQLCLDLMALTNLPDDLAAVAFKAVDIDLEFDANSDVDSKVRH